ncbi:MAG: endonuclease/exonuclease/phosphatase family protein [Bdellovibrionota bacterium]
MNQRSNNVLKSITLLGLSVMAFAARANDIETARSTIKVMEYNVENLFDTVHDDGKEDWAYLPLSTKKSDPRVKAACAKETNPTFKRECLELDWSPKTLQSKITNIASVITSSFGGTGPDVIIFEEVENFAVLQDLQRNGLRNKGYNEIILIEGPDSRGIDTAILSKLPLEATTSHRIALPDLNGKEAHATRDILEATFKVGSKKLTVFANHWPSQGNPGANRIAAAETLVKYARAAGARGESVLAMGDFNSLLEEIKGPIGEVLNKDFVDGVEERVTNGTVKTTMPGSHWFRGGWSFLDRAYILKTETQMKIDWNDLDVYAPEFALRVNEYRRRDGSIEKTFIPFRYNAEQGTGYSDHLPLTLTLSL